MPRTRTTSSGRSLRARTRRSRREFSGRPGLDATSTAPVAGTSTPQSPAAVAPQIITPGTVMAAARASAQVSPFDAPAPTSR